MGRCVRSWIVTVVALIMACTVQPQRDWARLAIEDLHFIRDTLGENHPGPVDTANPWFKDWFEQGFQEALRLAARANSFAGSYFAIQYYLRGFQDGHLGAFADDRFEVDLQRRWPGFIVGLRGDRFEVVDTDPAAPDSPPTGAVLLACDGRDVAAWADEVLQPYIGLWSVRGARPRSAPFLLIDEGNPFVSRPSSCTFEVGGDVSRLDLDWRAASNDDLRARVEAARQQVVPPIGLRTFAEGAYWITLSSFNANSDAVAEAIEQLIAHLEAEVDQLRAADVIVFDVRGNTGGNSSYGTMAAAALWGRPYTRSRAPSAEAVDWRASVGNVRFIKEFNLERARERFGDDSDQARSLQRLVGGLESALERGDVYHRSTFERTRAPEVPNPVSAPVFLLTDSFCGSACLDFADLLLALEGVTHIGQETSADAIYIDNRSEELPSGLGRVGFSMKVYRGRPRGHNESYRPRHQWTGRMDDTAGLQQWVLGLAEGPGRRNR